MLLNVLTMMVLVMLSVKNSVNCVVVDLVPVLVKVVVSKFRVVIVLVLEKERIVVL